LLTFSPVHITGLIEGVDKLKHLVTDECVIGIDIDDNIARVAMVSVGVVAVVKGVAFEELMDEG
jgi:hypothetical protein